MERFVYRREDEGVAVSCDIHYDPVRPEGVPQRRLANFLKIVDCVERLRAAGRMDGALFLRLGLTDRAETWSLTNAAGEIVNEGSDFSSFIDVLQGFEFGAEEEMVLFRP